MGQVGRSTRILGLAIGLAFATAPLCRSAAPEKQKRPAKRPNVIFFLTDDQRADTIGALGNPHIQTPNIDRLVREGMVFHRAYCMGSMVGAVCMPSRTMILTGQSLFHISRKRRADTPIFPWVMRMAGYLTYRTGKRGNNPRYANDLFHVNSIVPRSPTCSKVHADQAIAFLRKAAKDPRPFFLYVAWGHPHDPRVVPKAFMDKYKPGDVPLPLNYLPVHPFDNGEMTIRDEKLAPWPRTKDVIRKHLADYYATITYLDHHLGRILQTLKEIGEYDNTIIIFSSDHGLAIGSHGLMGKQSVYDHSMRVPFIISGPGIPKGRSSNAFIYLFDVFPTVCDLCGVPIPEKVEGKSIVPIIQGKAPGVRDSVFLAYKVQRAVRTDRWKLIRYTHINKSQLFDMSEDPHEIHDLAGDPKHAPKVKELMQLLRQWQKKLDDKMPLSRAHPQDPSWTPPKQGQKKRKRRRDRAPQVRSVAAFPTALMPLDNPRYNGPREPRTEIGFNSLRRIGEHDTPHQRRERQLC